MDLIKSAKSQLSKPKLFIPLGISIIIVTIVVLYTHYNK